MELPDLGWRRVHALIVRAAGAFRVENLLVGFAVARKNGPISEAKSQRGNLVGG